mmetsp:Transcript_81038/g.161603  ORF Transcript_81038/g.161603 Transcript_81038/m.161603 type:complete len:216 (-) Transcript_81038:510-1157(-)
MQHLTSGIVGIAVKHAPLAFFAFFVFSLAPVNTFSSFSNTLPPFPFPFPKCRLKIGNALLEEALFRFKATQLELKGFLALPRILSILSNFRGFFCTRERGCSRLVGLLTTETIASNNITGQTPRCIASTVCGAFLTSANNGSRNFTVVVITVAVVVAIVVITVAAAAAAVTISRTRYPPLFILISLTQELCFSPIRKRRAAAVSAILASATTAAT